MRWRMSLFPAQCTWKCGFLQLPVTGGGVGAGGGVGLTTAGALVTDGARVVVNQGIESRWVSVDGSGTLDFDETQKWLDWMDERSISSANWALSDKMESCSAFQPGAAANGKWSPSISGDLTWSGLRVRNYLSHGDAISCDGEGWPCVAPPCSDPNDECSDTRCCSDAGYTCYAKDHWWAQCMTSCGGDGQEDWSCDVLVPTTTPVAFTV